MKDFMKFVNLPPSLPNNDVKEQLKLKIFSFLKSFKLAEGHALPAMAYNIQVSMKLNPLEKKWKTRFWQV